MDIKKSESLFIDFKYEKGKIPEGFTATAILVKDNKIIYEKELDISDDGTTFLLRIKSNELSNLESDVYNLIVFVENKDLGYKEYVFKDILYLEDDFQ